MSEGRRDACRTLAGPFSAHAILEARSLAPDVKLFRIEAKRVERIPITIPDSDTVAGSITQVVQGIGKTTRLLNSLEAGDEILDVVSPLDRRVHEDPGLTGL